MKNFKNIWKFAFIAIIGLPVFAFAQVGNPNVVWNEQIIYTEIDGEEITTGSIEVSNLVNPASLDVMMLVDSGSDFAPPDLVIELGTPPANGVMDFSFSGAPAGTFFLPIIIDSASYLDFFTINDGSQFQVFIPGQEAFSAAEVVAPPPDPNDPGTDTTAPGSTSSTLVYTDFSRIKNPLGEDWNAWEFLHKLFSNFVKIALPFLVIFMVYSGFLFVEAQGNEEKLSKAKKNFLYVIIGALLILSAWTIALVLKGTVTQFEASIYQHIINLV